MVTPHCSAAPVVPLFTNETSTQWRSAILATVAVSKFRKTLSKNTRQQGLGAPEQLDSDIQKQNGSSSENGDTDCQASRSEEENQALDIDKTLKATNPEVEVLKLIRDDLEKQLDAYGIVLVLLAGITFVGILQPPGSFSDEGKLHESVLVSLFMLLATLSFFVACTALGAVMVGCAKLFRPSFYPKLRTYTDVSKSKRLLSAFTTDTPARPGIRKWLVGCGKVVPNFVAVDDVHVLAELCLENVYRIWRIRLYLGVALVLCIAAYICGALAIMVTSDRRRYMLIGAMGVGGLILLYEICITLSTAKKPVPESIDGQPRLNQQLLMYTNGRYEEGHPAHTQMQP